MTIFDNYLEFLVGSRDVLSFYDLRAVTAQYQCKGEFPTMGFCVMMLLTSYWSASHE